MISNRFGQNNRTKKSVAIQAEIIRMKFTLFVLFIIKQKEVRKMKMSLTENKGQGMVEYAFILMLVAIVVISAVTLIGPRVGNMFSSINSSL